MARLSARSDRGSRRCRSGCISISRRTGPICSCSQRIPSGNTECMPTDRDPLRAQQQVQRERDRKDHRGASSGTGRPAAAALPQPAPKRGCSANRLVVQPARQLQHREDRHAGDQQFDLPGRRGVPRQARSRIIRRWSALVRSSSFRVARRAGWQSRLRRCKRGCRWRARVARGRDRITGPVFAWPARQRARRTRVRSTGPRFCHSARRCAAARADGAQRFAISGLRDVRQALREPMRLAACAGMPRTPAPCRCPGRCRAASSRRNRGTSCRAGGWPCAGP